MKSNTGLNVAIVGATGAVGQELLSILKARSFPVKSLELFSSSRSEGKVISWNGSQYTCKSLKKGCFEGIQIVFFDASDAVSKEWVPQAAAAGAWVVDNSASFRMEKDIFLVVPEVNGDLIEKKFKNSSMESLSWRDRVLSGPNCSAAPLCVALKPIAELWGIRRVVVSTYQATSGAGTLAVQELVEQTGQVLKGALVQPQIFPHRIAFNCIPHIGSFKEDGYTGEEQKIVEETQKMLGLPGLKMSVTAVRVPTTSCHSLSVNVECERPVTPEEFRQVLSNRPGIILQDDPARKVYPMPMTHEGDTVEGASGRDAVYIGRIRKDSSVTSGLNFWAVSDNLRKGAALNAVQIAEVLLKTTR